MNATPGEFDAELIERNLAIRSDTGLNPFAMRRQFATRRMALFCKAQASRWLDAGSSCC